MFNQMNALGQMPPMGGMVHSMGGQSGMMGGQPGMQNALAMPTRPDRPQFDLTALRGAAQGMAPGTIGQAWRSGDMSGMPQPLQDAYGQWQGYQDAMGQYRNDRGDYRQQQHMQMHNHGGPMMQGAPIPGTPAMPNTQFPLNPAMQRQPVPGQVGSQLGVIGATPAMSPFGLPGY